jgi:lactate dehydrogenase-like 2-hydroxyacid dehydrogenase
MPSAVSCRSLYSRFENTRSSPTVDLNRARARSIRVTTTPGVLTDDVADMAFGLLLAVSRQLCIGDRFVRDGKWPTQTLPLASKVSGKRLGILGLGRVGRAIARRAEGFDMPIAYTDISPISDVPYRFVANLRDLAVHSEVLIIAASGGPESRGIVDASVLDALGRDGILVNVARGSVVDQPALVAALRERRLGGAGLDVFADEPHVPEALWSLDNVVLQPHQASATVETRLAMGEMGLANLAAHFAGKPLPSAVV